MSSIADLARPSSILLLVVAVANVTVAIAEWRRAEASVPDASVPDASVPEAPAEIVLPVAAIERRALPAPVDRVALRRQAPVCRAWGPFTALEDAEALASRLALPGEAFEVYQGEIPADPDYLVTVRAPGDREAAERILKELESRSIDSYILERGPEGNVLAVGVFSRPAGASRRQRQIATLGYQADVEPLQRSHRIYHLLARVPADHVSEVPAAGGCSDIAPVQQFL